MEIVEKVTKLPARELLDTIKYLYKIIKFCDHIIVLAIKSLFFWQEVLYCFEMFQTLWDSEKNIKALFDLRFTAR